MGCCKLVGEKKNGNKVFGQGSIADDEKSTPGVYQAQMGAMIQVKDPSSKRTESGTVAIKPNSNQY